MSFLGRSLFHVDDLDNQDIEELFNFAGQLKSNNFHSSTDTPLFHRSLNTKIIGMVFFEPSTRTRVSFEMAAKRLGFEVVTLDSIVSSSLSKGESLVDTVETIASMRPDLVVARYGNEEGVTQCLKELPMPVINAGHGSSAHPTQALLDAFTIKEKLGRIESQKILFVGDVFHSRVANSNLRLLSRLGAEVAVCAPKEMVPRKGAWESVQQFESLDEALPWCNACMGLRIQSERHQAEDFGYSMEEYVNKYRIDESKLVKLSSDAIVMHPGPFKPGVDFSNEVLNDTRSVVREQVTNGVFIRAALMAKVFGLEAK